MCVPLKAQTHFVCQSMQQQHRLPPGSVYLIPLDWDTGKSTQTEVVDSTKLAAVPEQQQEQTIYILSQQAFIYFCPGFMLKCCQVIVDLYRECVYTRCEMWHWRHWSSSVDPAESGSNASGCQHSSVHHPAPAAAV